ncbi:MAG: ABC transporter permease [Mycoplasmataceae bacterium]|nr:ABC transporter permease [Mycoplasmataceae bacterium]
MKKLFKEIWKSLSNTKTLIFGLIVLTFLSSGVFTILSDVKTSYTTQFNDYKKVSKIHDLTVDTDIVANGEKPSQIYIPGLDTEKTEYISVNDVGANKKVILIPKKDIEIEPTSKEPYVKISKLFITPETEETNYYVKVKDLYHFFQTNNIINYIDENNFVAPSNFSPTVLNKYIKPGVNLPVSYQLKTTDKITSFKDAIGNNITFGDLINVIPGSTSFFGSTNDRITNVKSIYINADTKMATISQTVKQSWEKQGVLVTINSNQVAQLLGFKHDSGGVYSVNTTNNQKGFFPLVSPTGTKKWRLGESLNKIMVSGGFSLNLNDTMVNDFNLNSLNQFFELNKQIFIRPSWVVNEKISYEFERYYSKINYDFENSLAEQNKLWTKNYSAYISNLSKEEKQYYSQTSFWRKTQIIEIVGNDGITVIEPQETIRLAQKITFQDLNRELKLKPSPKVNGPRAPNKVPTTVINNSILWFERESNFISQSDIDQLLQNPNSETSINIQSIINNLNSKNERIKKIDEGAKAIAQEELFHEILKLVGSIENIGLRESLTVSGFNNKDSNIFHFINGGNKDQEIKLSNDITIQQNVGKLYNEENEKSLLFSLSSEDDISSSKVPQTYIFKIMDLIFKGMSVDKNYINTVVTFENYTYTPYSYYQNSSNSTKVFKNAKILRMQSGTKIYGITRQTPTINETNGKYYILKEVVQGGKKTWISDNPIEFDGSEEKMQNFIKANNLNFASVKSNGDPVTVVGANGWAKQNKNYSNKYSIPFKIMIPSSSIINNWQESNNFNVFRDNLISSMTELVAPLISPLNFNILVESMTTSFTKNGFADVLVFPSKIENRKLQKILFGIFYEGSKHSEKLFWNEFLDEIFEKIINNPDENNIENQIKTLSKLLSTILGETFDMTKIMTFVNNPKEMVKGLRKIISSINIDETIIQIWNNFYDIERPKNEVIGVGDILPIVINNISPDNPLDPSFGFKAGLKQIISELNFAKIINYVKEEILDSESLELFGPILDQLNNLETVGDFTNINSGLNKIIDLINLDAFGLNIKNNSAIREYFIDEEKGPEKYLINSISISGIFASLLDSLGKNNDSDDALFNAIIEMMNVSSKTSWVGFLGIGLYQPDSDPNKLDIRDLQSLLKSHTPKLNELNISLQELSILLINPEYVLDPNSIIGEYVTNYIFDYQSDVSIKNKDIKKRVDIYLEFMNQTEFKNFDPNGVPSSGGVLGTNIPNPTEPNTLADKFINIINPNVREKSSGFRDTVMDQVYSEFFTKNNPLQSRDMTVEILSFYSFWMKLTQLSLNENEEVTIDDVKKQIIFLVSNVLDKNSQVGKIINNTSQEFNGALMSFKILDGYSNAKETALKLANANPETWLPREALNYYFDYNNGKFEINSKTISLVSGLSSIIPFDTRKTLLSDLVTKDFIEMFLRNDKEESNIMLTSGLRTLNTLSGPANAIMENLGLSSAIMSPFSGVVNAPVVLWFTVNQAANSETSIGNLQFIIKQKLYKFNTTEHNTGINYEGFKGIIDEIIGGEIFIDNPSSMNQMITLSLDADYLDYLVNELLVNPETGNNLEIFGIDAAKALQEAIGSFTEAKIDDFQIVISDIASYLVKINEAYLNANRKEVYKIDSSNMPSNSIEMDSLLKSLDSKYKINVNGLEFLIVGVDSTVDYLYPVTNLDNIQVDTKSQVLMYVNQQGFDRVKESNANANIDKYFLLISPKGLSPSVLRNKINKYVYMNITGLNNYDDLSESEKNNFIYKKAFLYNEFSPLNPERSLRVQTIETLISTLNNANILISSILVSLIGIITIFIVKRYISSKSKVLGILKAQGYKSIQIAASICILPLIVTFFGASLGYIVGYLCQIPIMGVFSGYWTLPIIPLQFDIVSLAITVFLPLFGLILLTIMTTLYLLRIKPTELMDGSFQLNHSKSAEIIKSKFKSKNIKSKFTLSLSLNSIWKLISLFVSLLFTVTIISFSIASNNAFGHAIHKTYQNRKYNFKIDLTTPTLEGGSLSILDKQSLEDLLYVPIGNPNEGATYLGDYFKPGPNGVINFSSGNENYYPNGKPKIWDKHVITKSSLDLIVNSGGIEVNVWNTLFNSMPDSQRSTAIAKSQYASKWLEWSQDLENYGQDNEHKLSASNDLGEQVKVPYFKYIINEVSPQDSKFVYRNINEITGDYFYQDIVISGEGIYDPDNKSLRDKYRDFLVTSYDKALSAKNEVYDENEIFSEVPQDYFITFGSVIFNNEKNEKFSYASTVDQKDVSHTPIINGYNQNSEQIKIVDSSGQNLIKKANMMWKESKTVVPVIINHVVKDSRNLNIGSKIELKITNNTGRFTNVIKEKLNLGNIEKTTQMFEVIGINETYIDEEWTTSQEIINEITYLNNPLLSNNEEIPFNGVLSTEEIPMQATGALSLYSENGYWAADEKIDLSSLNNSTEQQEKNKNIFRELFFKVKRFGTTDTYINGSVFATTLKIINPNFTEIEIESLILKLLQIEDITLSQVVEPGNESRVNNSLELFAEIYGNNSILSPTFMNIKSKNIESGFISNTTNAINSVSTMVIVLSLLISITTLIMISTLIINENERNAAIFSILGYNHREKMILFFSLYVPIIILSILLSIPLTMGLIAAFTSIVNSSVLISLSVSVNFVNILLSSTIVVVVFSLTSLISWINLSKIKPIMLLKGD